MGKKKRTSKNCPKYFSKNNKNYFHLSISLLFTYFSRKMMQAFLLTHPSANFELSMLPRDLLMLSQRLMLMLLSSMELMDMVDTVLDMPDMDMELTHMPMVDMDTHMPMELTTERDLLMLSQRLMLMLLS